MPTDPITVTLEREDAEWLPRYFENPMQVPAGEIIKRADSISAQIRAALDSLEEGT